MQSSEFNWSAVYRVWLERARKCGFNSVTFTDVTFERPEFFRRDDELHWWPIDGVEVEKQKLLMFWDEFPGAWGRTNTLKLDKGPQDTLEFLWHHLASPEHQAATLITAFLFPYIGSSRPLINYVDAFGISRADFGKLFRVAYDKAFDSRTLYGWSTSCTNVLPPSPELNSVRFGKILTLVEYIAERNTLMLNSYQPVRLIFNQLKTSTDKAKKPQ